MNSIIVCVDVVEDDTPYIIPFDSEEEATKTFKEIKGYIEEQKKLGKGIDAEVYGFMNIDSNTDEKYSSWKDYIDSHSYDYNGEDIKIEDEVY